MARQQASTGLEFDLEAEREKMLLERAERQKRRDELADKKLKEVRSRLSARHTPRSHDAQTLRTLTLRFVRLRIPCPGRSQTARSSRLCCCFNARPARVGACERSQEEALAAASRKRAKDRAQRKKEQGEEQQRLNRDMAREVCANNLRVWLCSRSRTGTIK